MKTFPSNTLSRLWTILHTWFRFGRNTGYFWPTEPLSIRPLDWKYSVFLPKRNQACRIVLIYDKVILGEDFTGSESYYLTFSKFTNFIHASTTEFKFYVIMKWAIKVCQFAEFPGQNYICKLHQNRVGRVTWCRGRVRGRFTILSIMMFYLQNMIFGEFWKQ